MRVNRRVKFVSKCILIFLLIISWLFSGWPGILIPGFGVFPPNIRNTQASATTPTYASTAANDSSIGTTAWNNPTYGTTSNDSKADVSLAKNAGVSQALKATGFGFAIPTNARIDGIKVEWEKSDNLDGGAGDTVDNAVRIVKAGAIGSTDLSNATGWTQTDTFVSYGGASELWGDSWTAGDINGATFGAAISAKNAKQSGGGAATIAYIDSVRITVTYTLPTMTVSKTGSQTATLNIGANKYIGGAFTFITDLNTVTVTQITVTDTGTVNANSNLSNVDIYYETAGTCTYDGGETLFGTAATFNASEKATVTSGSMSVGTSQVCVYVVLDIGGGASDGETIKIEISNPSTEVLIQNGYGTVTPGTPVALGTSTLQSASATFTQNKYRWYVNNNLADPADVWGAPDLPENTAITIIPAGNDPPSVTQDLRLRVNIAVNTADLSAGTNYFKLEYKQGTDGSCTSGSWTDVGDGVWTYSATGATDGANITESLSDTTAAKGEQYVRSKDSGTSLNHVGATYIPQQIMEYDFHIIGGTATPNTTYNFRVVGTDGAGSAEVVFDGYTNCPTLTTEPGTSSLLRHGDVFTNGSEQGFFWAN
jgi:hypothetical protein